jgi:glycosyltransferase involved in cell wall biosynthesis
MKIVILKSKKNLVWVSMNEIIPWIIRLWEKWAAKRGHKVSILDVDEDETPKIFSELFTSDLVIVTSFTTSMARVIYLARKKLQMPLKCVVYLHNQATIGCWPFYEWKMGDVLDTGDVFVGSCSRDKSSMDACFKNAQTVIHPFSLDDYELTITPPTQSEIAHFVFIGRISPQKNLHTAIWALHLLTIDHPELKWKFEMYGSEDHYGSPLMGIGCDTYQEFLNELIEKYDLSDRIIFRGFQDRSKIQEEMSGHQRIFLAPSLHSDENFGMAAFRMLSQGHKVLLSDWGGHGDYREHFRENLFLVKVRESKSGPYIDVQDLVAAMVLAAEDKSSHVKNSSYYTEEKLFTVLDSIAHAKKYGAIPVERNELGKRIHEKRNHYYQLELAEKENTTRPISGCRIFENFSDPDSLVMFRAYGMDTATKNHTGPAARAPWVHQAESGLSIYDPMKGQETLSKTTRLSEDKWLIEHGYATPIGDET